MVGPLVVFTGALQQFHTERDARRSGLDTKKKKFSMSQNISDLHDYTFTTMGAHRASKHKLVTDFICSCVAFPFFIFYLKVSVTSEEELCLPFRHLGTEVRNKDSYSEQKKNMLRFRQRFLSDPPEEPDDSTVSFFYYPTYSKHSNNLLTLTGVNCHGRRKNSLW